MSDFIGQIQREYSKNYRDDASFITADFVAKLIIEADKPRLGVIHEATGYTWMRAWDKHEGWSIPRGAVEQQIATAVELPSTAVYPCNWYTYAHHIKHEDSNHSPGHGAVVTPLVIRTRRSGCCSVLALLCDLANLEFAATPTRF